MQIVGINIIYSTFTCQKAYDSFLSCISRQIYDVTTQAIGQAIGAGQIIVDRRITYPTIRRNHYIKGIIIRSPHNISRINTCACYGCFEQ